VTLTPRRGLRLDVRVRCPVRCTARASGRAVRAAHARRGVQGPRRSARGSNRVSLQLRFRAPRDIPALPVRVTVTVKDRYGVTRVTRRVRVRR
jgi:hypothetical protein